MLSMKLSEKIKAFLAKRQNDYWQTFNLESQAVKAVLKDLEGFCRENESCFHADPRVHAVLEGRREVLLRIKRHIKLKPEELIKYYTTKGRDNG